MPDLGPFERSRDLPVRRFEYQPKNKRRGKDYEEKKAPEPVQERDGFKGHLPEDLAALRDALVAGYEYAKDVNSSGVHEFKDPWEWAIRQAITSGFTFAYSPDPELVLTLKKPELLSMSGAFVAPAGVTLRGAPRSTQATTDVVRWIIVKALRRAGISAKIELDVFTQDLSGTDAVVAELEQAIDGHPSGHQAAELPPVGGSEADPPAST